MAFEITTTNALDHTNVSIVVVGPPGIGKTPFALTAPKPFLLNAEAGVQSVAHLQVPMTQVSSTEQLVEIRNILALPEEERTETLGFEVETVVIDTIDEITRIATHERLESQKKAEMQPGDWSWLADEMNALVRGFRGLDMNVIFVCHTKDQQSGDTGEVFHKPDISGAFGHQLPAAVDIVGLIERHAVIDDQGDTAMKTFFITDDRHGYSWLKNRGKLPAMFELNFEDDVQRIHDEFFSGIEYAEPNPRVIDYALPEEEVTEVDDSPSMPANPTVDEVRDQISEAQEVVKAATEQKKASEKQAVLTEPSSMKADDIDTSNLVNGERIVDSRFDTTGFELKPDGTLKNARETRFHYILEDGTRVISVNQLEKGVLPIPNPEVGTGIFCQTTGAEVTRDHANVSRIRFRKVFSEEEFGRRVASE